ncbi:MAG TPA: FG-GAP repeat protein, partial [Vicinamibacteria bacterium]
SRLDFREGRLSIDVDDRGASYPLTVDPLFQAARLTASDAQQNDELGYSVSVSAETVVVGAPFANANAGATADAGAAYVFVMGAGGWANMTQTAKLTASDGEAFDFFGFAVAIDGDTIVVGALDDDLGGGSNQGSAYVFVRPAAGWVDATESAKLTASDAAGSDEFGCAVSVSRDVIVVGSRFADNGAPGNQGAAYVFVRPGGGWTTTSETAKLSATDGTSSDLLGAAVAVDRDTIIAGAPGKDGTAANEGAAYVFEEPGGGWVNMTQTAKLTALVPGSLDELGISVALDGNVAVAGAWGADVGGNVSQGAAYVYERPGGGWANATETAQLTASDGGVADFFGVSVATGGDAVIVGSYQNDVGASSSQGSAYLFVAPAAGWVSATETEKLLASDGAAGDEFGRAVAIGEGVAVAGSHLFSSSNTGAAYVFDIPIATSFFTLTPCRVVDTRGPDGPLGGPALAAGADREFTLVGACGIPDTALAVSVNLAVTGASALGNLRLHPGGSAVPLVSTINYGAGQTRSNNAIVRLNDEGALAAYVGQASGTVHLVLDVNGYFQP